VLATEAEQGLEGGHRCAASVEAEDVLVEVDLQVRAGNAAMGSSQPALEVGDRPMDARQQMLVGVRSLAARAVLVAEPGAESR
jgi:hypothetical protein